MLLSGSNPWTRIEFRYDWMGRRISKMIQTTNDDPAVYGTKTGPPIAWSLDRSVRYVWDGWHLSLSYLAGGGSTYVGPDQSFAWGPDLSSGYGGAGGIGGLVAYCDDDFDTNNPTNDPDLGPMYPIYDGNGNVVRMCRFAAVGSGGFEGVECHTAAAYEYGPFGEALSVTGEDLGPAGAGGQGQRNPFRFSTKYTDAETGLVYYGYRYYSPGMGRWVSRDPIEESDGPNVFAYVRNAPSSYVDAIGLRRLVIAFGGLGERGGLSVQVVTKDWAATLSASSVDWHPFYQTQRDAARKLVLSKVKEDRAPAGPPSPGQTMSCEYDTLIILGFSWGGDAALALTGDLEKDGIKINLVFVVDPVKKPLGASFKKRPNVERLVNRYQRIGAIAGKSVAGADHEDGYLYPDPRVPTGPNGETLKDLSGHISDPDHRRLWNAHVDNSYYGAHVDIALMPSTLNMLKKEVEDVPESRSDWK